MPKFREDRWIFFLLILFFCIFFSPSVALTWNSGTHYSMVNDARFFLPKTLDSNLSKTVSFILEPDQNRIIKHTDIGACAYQIQRLAEKAIKMIQEKENIDEAFATIGKGTHYVQDLNCPHHGIGRYDRGLHERFESKVLQGFWEKADFDGFQYILDYKIFAYNAARFSKRYINYCNSMKYDSDYFDRYKKLIDPLWDHTVNDCLDYWLTILWDGLGEEKYIELGLPSKVGTRAEKKIKFPKVKHLWD